MQAHPLSNTASYSPQLPPPLPEATPPLAASPRGLAHDAGNLLGALALYADLLRAPGVLRPEHRHYADELRVLSHRGTLLLSRWQEACGNGSLVASPAQLGPTDAAASLRMLLPVLERMAGSSARVVLEAPDFLPGFPLCIEALERVVTNLVRNAATALAAQGRGFRRRGLIRVSLAATPATATLTVEDDGPGLDAALVTGFLQSSAFPPAATGLGLRIVHELTAGARREVRSRPGEGTMFLFTWSRDAAPARPARLEDACAC